MRPGVVRDDFAGPGGFDEGLRLLGMVDVIGIERDQWACETAVAAGHRRVRADVRHVSPAPWAGLDGYVASPPCTSFSIAGRGLGTRVLAQIVAAAHRLAAGDDGALHGLGGDETTALILEPVRQVRDLRPRWVALEQVPPCLPVWRAYARLFRQWGYSAAAAVLCAADFGVPQTRRRAILVARLGGPAVLPEPTHAETPGDGLFGRLRPWVSMAEALGWGVEDELECQRGSGMLDRHGSRPPRPATMPAPTILAGSGGGYRRTVSRGAQGSTAPVGVDRPGPEGPTATPSQRHDTSSWVWERPATTIVGSFSPDVVAAPGYRQAGDGPRQNTPGSIRIQPWEAAVLQSFPAGYPWQGPKTAVFQQIGNAVPPRMAAAIITALLGGDT